MKNTRPNIIDLIVTHVAAIKTMVSHSFAWCLDVFILEWFMGSNSCGQREKVVFDVLCSENLPTQHFKSTLP